MELPMPSSFAQAAALSRVTALAYSLDNADAPAMDDAATNLANGCPAFWHRATGGNAVAGGFMAYLNRTQDVIRAFKAVEADFGTCRMREPRFRDALLPLNRAAAQSLAAAYDEVSVVRTPSELMRRTSEAEDQALAALAQLRRSETAHPLLAALGGLDESRIEAAERAVGATEASVAA
jgi:hypothetical protein